MVAEFAGNVPGPLSQVTLWPSEGLDQLNVTWPALTVSGVGVKKSFFTEIVCCDPPCP